MLLAAPPFARFVTVSVELTKPLPVASLLPAAVRWLAIAWSVLRGQVLAQNSGGPGIVVGSGEPDFATVSHKQIAGSRELIGIRQVSACPNHHLTGRCLDSRRPWSTG